MSRNASEIALQDSIILTSGKTHHKTYHTHIPVNRCYPLVGLLLHQPACDQLLQRKNNAVFAFYADCCTSVFYCFYCVFDLMKKEREK